MNGRIGSRNSLYISMAKRASVQKKASRSRKTTKRLATKRTRLASKRKGKK